MEIKKIETYSLYEFCQAVQQSIIDGWRFDFESNELFPTAFGSMLVTGMVKKPAETVEDNTEDNAVDNAVDKLVEEFTDKLQDIIEDESEVNQVNQVKRGRKPKQ
jgi:hypothetical protein